MRLYSEKTGDLTFEMGLLPHPTIPFIAVSTDSITFSGVNVELKCPRYRKISETFDELILRHDFPYYYDQCQLEAEITGLDKIHFVQFGIEPNPYYLGSRYLHICEVKKDHTWMSRNLASLAEFWEMVNDYKTKNPNWNSMVLQKRALLVPSSLIPEPTKKKRVVCRI